MNIIQKKDIKSFPTELSRDKMGPDIFKSDNQAIIEFVQKMESLLDIHTMIDAFEILLESNEYQLLKYKAGH